MTTGADPARTAMLCIELLEEELEQASAGAFDELERHQVKRTDGGPGIVALVSHEPWDPDADRDGEDLLQGIASRLVSISRQAMTYDVHLCCGLEEPGRPVVIHRLAWTPAMERPWWSAIVRMVPRSLDVGDDFLKYPDQVAARFGRVHMGPESAWRSAQSFLG